jgi:hypothetical protein
LNAFKNENLSMVLPQINAKTISGRQCRGQRSQLADLMTGIRLANLENVL